MSRARYCRIAYWGLQRTFAVADGAVAGAGAVAVVLVVGSACVCRRVGGAISWLTFWHFAHPKLILRFLFASVFAVFSSK